VNSRRSWVIFGIGVFAYLVAVMQRTSIGVAGVAATDRFHVSAAVLSSMAVVQLIVYAAMQVPVGVLIDRVGSRALMIAGTALMVVGQVTVAFAPTITLAIVGRILVGAGDATVFTSLMRLVNSWFRGRLVPQLSQWIGNIGQLGQVLSAVPFALLLHGPAGRPPSSVRRRSRWSRSSGSSPPSATGRSGRARAHDRRPGASRSGSSGSVSRGRGPSSGSGRTSPRSPPAPCSA
jgi:Nitrate/nitrite transporter